MSYDCDACVCNYNCGTNKCQRAARISNTNFLYNGFPIGDASNNCARTINENKSKIASFFDSLTSSPNLSCGRIEENVDYSGKLIGSNLAPSAEGCCSICSNYNGCKAFVWTNTNGGLAG